MQPVHGGNLAWAAAIAGCDSEAILDFSASINPLGPPQSAIAAIQSAISQLSSYPDPNYSELRTALAQVHQLSPEWILPGNGSADLLTWAGWDLSELAATYLVTPAFGDYWRALKAFGAKVVECPLRAGVGSRELGAGDKGTRGQGDKGDMEAGEQFTIPLNPHSSLLAPPNSGLLLNNPHNPTGWLWRREEILPYLEQFALVVVDEAFMDFLPPAAEQSLIPLVQKYPNLVILRSLTKFYSLPGLRLGYAIAHPERLNCWLARRDPWAVNTLAVAAVIAVLQDSQFQQQTWAWLPPTRSRLEQELSQIPGLQPLPGAANFLLVESERPSSKLQQQLLKHERILIRDCLSFPELGDRYFRVAVRSTTENERLIKALWQITT
ncbi:MAG: Threonine-phosphate decarboxylase [Chroococcidiopsis cubana SAG 39.79]|uniref:threonine-phosphate decarboxylase CobD n=1 Tax=Chroococcidiopsis cubana TaxID=171392 RepID=UPI002AC750CD|nr:threonine-phosphate decarboxylase CobD [Chroococcidiopsis cubana]MDZ4878792.1 Threonine-phosphate decarboxylase [Chroococcidiopsis cubana SAG 39.79]